MKFLRKRAYFWENRAGARKKQGRRTFFPKFMPVFRKYQYLAHLSEFLSLPKALVWFVQQIPVFLAYIVANGRLGTHQFIIRVIIYMGFRWYNDIQSENWANANRDKYKTIPNDRGKSQRELGCNYKCLKSVKQ